MPRLQIANERYLTHKLKWFSRSPYAATQNLTAFGWLEQLAFRIDVFQFLLRWERNPSLTLGDFSMDDLLGILMKSPIIDAASLNHDGFGLQHFSTFLGVHTIDGILEKVVSSWETVGDPRFSLKFAVSNSAIFVVDLDAPDTVAIDQFVRELKRARRSRKVIRRDPFKTQRWFKIGLLPYIDINLWARRNAIGRIPDVIIGRKILGRDRTGLEHMIAMVTRKKADSLLQLGTNAFLEQIRLMHVAGK